MVTHKFKNIIQLILVIIAIFLISYIVNYIVAMIITQKQTGLLNDISANTTLASDIENIQNADWNSRELSIIENLNNNINDNLQYKATKHVEKNERMLKIEALQNENKDIKGWIEIPGTTINYPVLQGEDNEFYVNHNYKKNKVKSGAIFIDMMYSWDKPSTNMLIYGHNMKNGTMFTTLMNYQSKSYYEKHPSIRFTTNTSDSTYDIIAAFESKAYKDSENVFKYYDFINANNEDEFNNYITNIKKMSIYDTGKTAMYGDELMTLSTCAYHTENGRFVVVAKKGL